ncbi:MAG TPA: hypothetical protein VI357_07975 [Mycobacteriales bacterium]
MSRRMTLLAAVLLGAALAGCGANGGDPVARRQIPAADPAGSDAGGSGMSDDGSSAPGDSDSSAASEPGSAGADPAEGSGSSSGGSGNGSGGGGKGSGDDHARKTGLPKSIRIPEIGQQAFEQGVVAACGDKNGAPDCLTVRYETVQDPDHGCGFEWTSDPAKESTSDGLESIVPRGATLTVTIFTCPAPDESGSSATPDDSAAPDGSEPTPEDSATTPDPGTPTATP